MSNDVWEPPDRPADIYLSATHPDPGYADGTLWDDK